MLSPTALIILALSILGTSFLSGVLGIGGGIILLGICLVLLDVSQAMVLHGIIQLAANGWRALLWSDHIEWSILGRYGLATIAVYVAARFVALLPDKATIYIVIGLMPLATEMLPRRWAPNIQRPGAPYVCAALMAGLQAFAGAAGNIIDLFFQNSTLDRKQIVATKAAAQVIGHAGRVIYFGSFLPSLDEAQPWWVYVVAVGLAMAGTTLAGKALHTMTDEQFRRWTRIFIHGLSVVFIARGVWLLVT
jgi:uncharacterized membrane protein YfcA